MRKIMGIFLFITLLTLTACSGNANNAATEGASSTTVSDTGLSSGTASDLTEPSPPKDLPKVAFVFATPIGETGWNFEMDRGRIALEKELGVETLAMDNVAESDANRVFEELAQNYDIIFGTTFGYMDAIVTAAEKYPDVKFLHATGYKTLDNLATYMGREYQSNYLVGIIAGKMAKNKKIGYIGTFAIPEVISAINAFTLGAQSVNPDVEVSVIWSNTWFNPTAEKLAADTMIDYGVDVLAAYHDAPTILQAAAEKGVWGSGKDSDMNKYAPETYLTNFIWNWSPYFVETVKSIIDGTWKTGSYFGGMKEGITDIAPFGKNVPQDVRDLVEAKKKEILGGTFDVFEGPVLDQTGAVRVKSDKPISDEEILSMNWFVKGIKGEIKN
ncbi:BMP family ABC transporter substrate-binding protein [Cohnella sp.]|uniref:BMP family ABC transporter substrate-binding protein n=1 Tax=Cohnella sp. TaxID=1883426 RepID=UPI0035695459